MGFLDKIKQQATDVASTVVETTKETATSGKLQMHLRTLRSEEKEAFEALGREVHRLHGEGRLEDETGQTLAPQIAAVGDVQGRITAKEAELAEVKDEEPPADGATVEGEAEEIVEPQPEDGQS